MLLVSAAQQSESVNIYVNPLLSIFHSYISHYGVLSGVPSAIQWPLLVICFIHSSVYTSISISQFNPSPPFLPSNDNFIFYSCDSFCFVNRFVCTFFFLIPCIRSIGEGNGIPLWYLFLPGKSHGWRSLVGYGPWGR